MGGPRRQGAPDQLPKILRRCFERSVCVALKRDGGDD